MSTEWKEKLKKYYNGELSEEEALEVEEELDRLDDYQEILGKEIPSVDQENDREDIPPEKVQQILNSSIRHAKFSLVAYVVMILLLIYPIMVIASYLYYGVNNKAEELIDVAINTVYVTEPNVSLEEMEIEEQINLFHFQVQMDLFKRIGKKDIKQGEWQVKYLFDDAKMPVRNYITESPKERIPYFDTKKLYHPKATITNRDNTAWDTLEKLPEGTVSEIYVSLNKLTNPDEMPDIVDGMDVEWRWYAIDTGLESTGKDLEGRYLAPIGYPAQTDPDAWSPYNNSKSNEAQFLDSLHLLEKYEDQAVAISHAKSLELNDRISYLMNHGIHVYAGVLTGPTKEILKLQENEAIRAIHIGEVRLWNW
ncbi:MULTISPECIES: anti-sigma factor [Virgibacillus]|uniref:anti-sigma factor n=1 Tax=Virgibacillus TaxID=84406 RepID=UPI000EF45716|nr:MULTISPECIES: anti-sigma factor [Virgibacillus]WBX81350.1 anti-sigma factor [Virgibacillus salarius]